MPEALRIDRVEDRPLVPLDGVIWRSCRFRVGSATHLRYEAADGPVAIDLPEHLRSAVDKRRSEFLAGRLCATLALRAAGAPEVIGRQGRAPVWPAGVRGSISHTADLAIAVVARRVSALGLDCEAHLLPRAVAEIAPLVLTDGDWAHRPRNWPASRFCTLLFSAKEALYKALSGRLEDIPDFREATVEAIGSEELALRFRDWRLSVRYSVDDARCTTLAWMD